jgi:hypothetical protein
MNAQVQSSPVSLSLSVEGAAWTAYNASFSEPEGEVYRDLGASLYRQAIRERIERLFSRSDQQNASIEAALKERG